MRRSVAVAIAVCTPLVAVACGLDAVGSAGPGPGSSTSSSTSSSSGSSGASSTSTSSSSSSSSSGDAAPDTWQLGPRLTLTRAASPSAIDLSTGTTDWSHWPTANLTPIRRTGGAIVGPLLSTGPGTVIVEPNCGVTVAWSNGSPQMTGTSNDCIYVDVNMAKFTLRFAASSTNLRIAHVLFGSVLARTSVTARMSDSSLPAPPAIERNEDLPVADDYRVEVLAPSSGAEVIVEIIMLERRTFGIDGRIYAGAATVTE